MAARPGRAFGFLSKAAGDRIAAFVHFLAILERSTIALLARIDNTIAASYKVLQLVRSIEQAETVTILQYRVVLGYTAVRELNRLCTMLSEYVLVHHGAPERRTLTL